MPWMFDAPARAAIVRPDDACTPPHPTVGRMHDLDPARLMQGFPPPPEYRVHVGNWQQYPQKIWSFQHVRELFGTRAIARSTRPAPWLAQPEAGGPNAFDTLACGPGLSWPQVLAQTHVDAALVVHRGRIVDERHFNGMTAATPHLMFSATKSMVGLMASVEIAEGRLDAAARVAEVLPELADSAWGDATVRQVLDMTDGVVFTEDYTDPASDIMGYVAAVGWLPSQRQDAQPTGICEHLGRLARLHPEPRGSAFRYRSPATDVAAWLATRSAGCSVSAWLQRRLWEPLGAEHEASLMLDLQGTEVSFAGLSACARDLARVGQLLLQGGRWQGRQLLPASVVADLLQGGDPAAFAAGGFPQINPAREGWSYRSQWWVRPAPQRLLCATGAFGQRLMVAPEDELVLVLFSSHPSPLAAAIDPLHFRALEALARHLRSAR